MKKITLVLIMFLLFAGVATASSINGDYNGKPIVKLKSNGQTLAVEDTPAVIMDGRTMVPISMLRQIGLGVEWNAEEYSVDVTLPAVEKVETIEMSVNILKLAKEMKVYNVGYVEYVSNGDGFNQLTFYYDLNILDDGSRTDLLGDDYNEMLSRSVVSDVTSTRIYDIYGNTITVLTDYVRDFISYKMTPGEFQNKLNITYAETNEVSNQQTIVDTAPTTQNIIKSKIESDFEGFDYGNIYELTNGQYWKQVDYTYKYSYKFRPDVLIYKDGLYYYMNVEGIDKDVKVELIE